MPALASWRWGTAFALTRIGHRENLPTGTLASENERIHAAMREALARKEPVIHPHAREVAFHLNNWVGESLIEHQASRRGCSAVFLSPSRMIRRTIQPDGL